MFYNRFFYEEELEFYSDENWLESYDIGSFSISDYQTSDTLVLHPDDRSTDFLCKIYEEKNWDVLNRSVSPEIVEELIECHDRIICLGHGSPAGLFGGAYGLLIHDGLAPLLKEKQMVSVWCFANQFMERHGLKGFYSGMFISELGEALANGIENTTEEAISISNDLFAMVLAKHIDTGNADNVLERIKTDYVGEDDPIIIFNRNRLFCNGLKEV